jgi:hypothetical protein
MLLVSVGWQPPTLITLGVDPEADPVLPGVGMQTPSGAVMVWAGIEHSSLEWNVTL